MKQVDSWSTVNWSEHELKSTQRLKLNCTHNLLIIALQRLVHQVLGTEKGSFELGSKILFCDATVLGFSIL